MQLYLIALLICFTNIFITACSDSYRYNNSQQGTLHATQNWESIKIGMSKKQVQETLGKAHIHPFNNNIWTYTHLINGKVSDQASILYFKNDKLEKIEVLQKKS